MTDVVCRTFLRGLPRLLVAGIAVFLAVAMWATVARATTFATTPAAQQKINATEAQLTAIEQTITQEQQQSAVLDQEYDAAVVHVQAVQAQLAATNANLHATQLKVKADKKVLAKAAIEDYVLGAQGTAIAPMFTSSADTTVITQEYAQTAIGDLDAAKQALQGAEAQLTVVESQQESEEQQAQQAASEVQTLEQQNAAATQQEEATLDSIKGTLATEVAQAAEAKLQKEEQEAQAAQAEAQREQEAKEAAELDNIITVVGGTSNAATQGANSVTSSAGGPTVTGNGAPTGGSGAGEAAVEAAESQLGVPYVWGGETPGVGFDCSGLTQWAWAQAGVSIPRTSQAQEASVPLVWTTSSGQPLDLSALAPGDLFFYYNLDGTGTVDHVAMYVGGDTLIQAPFTGTVVSYHSVYTEGLIAVGQP